MVTLKNTEVIWSSSSATADQIKDDLEVYVQVQETKCDKQASSQTTDLRRRFLHIYSKARCPTRLRPPTNMREKRSHWSDQLEKLTADDTSSPKLDFIL